MVRYEITPSYMMERRSAWSMGPIMDLMKVQVKLVFVIRNPAKRAYVTFTRAISRHGAAAGAARAVKAGNCLPIIFVIPVSHYNLTRPHADASGSLVCTRWRPRARRMSSTN